MKSPHTNKDDLTHGDVRKHLIRLTIPMIWGMFAIISVQLADTYFIATLGTQELAAISFTFPVTMVLTHIVFGLNIATSSVISRLIGEKRHEDVQRLTLHSLLLASSLSASIALLCYVLLKPLFNTLGADETTLPIIMDYMPIWLLSFILLAIPSNGNSVLRASGNSILPAIVMTTSSLINVILDPILIYGYFGFPALGVKGAALATLIAFIFGLIASLYILIRKRNLLSCRCLYRDSFKDSIKRLSVIALPAGLASIIMPATNAFITALLAPHGNAVVAAFGITGRVESFTMIMIIALATSMSAIIGQNWGARLYDRVHQTIHLAIRSSLVWSFTIAALLGIFAYQIGSFFSQDEEVLHFTTLFFWIVPFSYGFNNLILSWNSSFNAIGQPKRAFILIAAKAALVAVNCWIGDYFFGPIGLYVALSASTVIVGIAAHIISWRACLSDERP